MAKKKSENKVRINSSMLNKALKDISPAIGNSVLPILQSVHCSVKDNEMVLTTSDLGLTLVRKVSCEYDGELVFLMPHIEVYKITSKIAAQPIDIIINSHIVIRDSEGDFKLGKFGEPEHFPVKKDMEQQFKTVVDEKFIKAMQKATKCVAIGDNEIVFGNVLIDINENDATVLASDRLKMFRYNVKSDGGKFKALVTPRFIKALDGLKEVELSGNAEWVSAKSGNLEVVDRLPENQNQYPDCSRLFGYYKPNCKMAASELIQKLDEIMIFKNSWHECELIFNKGSIAVKYDDNDLDNHYEKEIKAKHSVETPSLAFNARELRSMLVLLDEDEIYVFFDDQRNGSHFDSEHGETNIFIKPLMKA